MATNQLASVTAVSDEHTQAFRGALKQSARNIVTMATTVAAVRDECGHKAMLAWLASEFDVSPAFAARLLRVHTNLLVSVNLTLDAIDQIAPSALYLLAEASTPDEVRGEIVEQAKAGKKITHAEAKQAVKVAVQRRQSPAETATPNPERIADLPPEPFESPALPRIVPAAPSPAKPSEPWIPYNEGIDEIVSMLRQASEMARALGKIDENSPAFAAWLDLKRWRQLFNDAAIEFDTHKVLRFASEKEKRTLPDGQNFIYVIDATRLKRKGA